MSIKLVDILLNVCSYYASHRINSSKVKETHEKEIYEKNVEIENLKKEIYLLKFNNKTFENISSRRVLSIDLDINDELSTESTDITNPEVIWMPLDSSDALLSAQNTDNIYPISVTRNNLINYQIHTQSYGLPTVSKDLNVTLIRYFQCRTI